LCPGVVHGATLLDDRAGHDLSHDRDAGVGDDSERFMVG
jgi:hypothetical protein